MQRSHKVVVVAHCVLNQNAVVRPLARAKGAFESIVTLLVNEGIGMVQLPCPETLYAGLNRLPQSFEDYDTPEYRALCQDLAKREEAYLSLLLQGGVEIIGMLGIGESPTCSQGFSSGHLMRALRDQAGFSKLRYLDIPADYSPETESEFLATLSQWIKGTGV